MAWFSHGQRSVSTTFFEGCKLWDYRVGLLWGVDLFFLMMALFLLLTVMNLFALHERPGFLGLGVVCKKGRMNDRLGRRLWVA